VGVYFDSVSCGVGELHCTPNGVYKENFFYVNILRMCKGSADSISVFAMRRQESFCSGAKVAVRHRHCFLTHHSSGAAGKNLAPSDTN
jgi:hypothetical protein